MTNPGYRIESVTAEPLSIPLLEPFVIATSHVDVTPNVLVSVVLFDLGTGNRVEGLGEAATLPGVTKESQQDILARVRDAALAGESFTDFVSLGALLNSRFRGAPAARAGVEVALLDAQARLQGIPLRTLIGGPAAQEFRSITTDITIPIADPQHMGELASQWWAKGFRHFKVKVGRSVDDDLAALEAIHRVTPDAWIRLDANAGYSAAETIAVARAVEELGLVLECFEQPCGRLALDAMAAVTAAIRAPVVADESVANVSDLARVVKLGAARGVNLKLMKSGGLLAALELGTQFPLRRMVGAMVETRLGIAAAASLVAALHGVDFADLDTALLLASDPFSGGYEMEGDVLTLSDAPGLGVKSA